MKVPGAALLVLALRLGLGAQAAEARLDGAIERGVAWLLAIQEPDGSWRGPQPEHYHGMTALAVTTLLKCGLGPGHPAVRAGLACVRARPCQRTYDVACRLLMLEALGAAADPAEARPLAERLVKTVGNGKRASGARWGYPGDHSGQGYENTDLSNTQYALLGLRAARRLGIPAGSPAFWQWVAQDLLGSQESYGGFGYRRGDPPRSSMTVAGLTGLSIAREVLGDQADLGLRGRLRAGLANGQRWLDRHWTVSTVLTLQDPPVEDSRWIYYHLYGIERLCAFEDLEAIGGRAWYAEGMRFILDKQGGRGSWGFGDDDTCFALLFLRRASRGSEIGPRNRSEAEIGRSAAFVIGTGGGNPARVWVRAAGEELRRRIADGALPVSLDWLVGGAPVCTVPVTSEAGLMADGTLLEHRFSRNGRHRIQGRLEIRSAVGEVQSLLSNVLEILVDDVEEPWQREAVLDAGRMVFDPSGVFASASSESEPARSAARAVDLHFGTSWVAHPSDKDPWLHLQFEPAVRAGLLKLCSAGAYAEAPDWFARPKDVEIRVNGEPPIAVRLADSTRAKQSIALSPRSVRTLRIRIRSVYPGVREAVAAGFKEIELFERAPPDPGGVLQAGSGFEFLTLPARDEGADWKYATAEPPPNWMMPSFLDHGWRTGKGGFGTRDRTHFPRRTEWAGAAICLRREFLAARGAEDAICLELVHDGPVQAFLNGVLALDARVPSPHGYQCYAVLPEAARAVRAGRNLLALCAEAGAEGAYVDAYLVRLLPR